MFESMLGSILSGFVLLIAGLVVLFVLGTAFGYVWVRVLNRIGDHLDELERKKREAQFQARMRERCPDGPPFKGWWYTGDDGKRFWLDWWNVPTVDL